MGIFPVCKSYSLKGRGFTLIELLIVVAIIAILAAIAVPNFLEAQTRSKVTRVLADQRTLITALESYRIDNNNYPLSISDIVYEELNGLTTPIAYLTSLPREVFRPRNDKDFALNDRLYDYCRYELRGDPQTLYATWEYAGSVTSKVAVVGVGPDQVQEISYLGGDPISDFSFKDRSYDATNGTVSAGDIYTFCGGGSMK